MQCNMKILHEVAFSFFIRLLSLSTFTWTNHTISWVTMVTRAVKWSLGIGTVSIIMTIVRIISVLRRQAFVLTLENIWTSIKRIYSYKWENFKNERLKRFWKYNSRMLQIIHRTFLLQQITYQHTWLHLQSIPYDTCSRMILWCWYSWRQHDSCVFQLCIRQYLVTNGNKNVMSVTSWHETWISWSLNIYFYIYL